MAEKMHTVLIPDKYLQQAGQLKLLDKTLVTADGAITDLGVAAYFAVVSTVLFTLTYKLSKFYTPLYFKGYRRLSHYDQRDWDTRLSNIIYSLYIVFWAVKLVALDDHYWKDPHGAPLMVHRSTRDSHAALGVSLGFFFFEFFVTLKYWMGGTPMVLHHIGSLLCVVVAAWGGHGHAFTLWMLSTEATTPFIALRYMLDKAGFKTHPVYVVNGLAILASWTVARLATFPPFFAAVWRHRRQLTHMNGASQGLLLVFPVVLAFLNTYWYTKIVAGAIKVLGRGKAKPRAKAE